MLLHHREKLEGHAAWPLGAGLPLLDRAFAGVEVARKNRLTHIVGLTELLYLGRPDLTRHNQMTRVKIAHRCFVQRANHVKHRCRRVDRLGNIALKSAFLCLNISPSGHRHPKAGQPVLRSARHNSWRGCGSPPTRRPRYLSDILLGEHILVNPISATLRKNDAPVHVLGQAFLKDPAAEIVRLARHDLPDRFANSSPLMRAFGAALANQAVSIRRTLTFLSWEGPCDRLVSRDQPIMFQTLRAAPKRADPTKFAPIQAGCSIGEAARASGVSAKMIRYYEAMGMVRPVARSAANYRSYHAVAIQTLRFIGRARALGVPMDMIVRPLALWQDKERSSAAVKALALQHIAELDERIAALQAMKAGIEHVAEQCHGDHRPDCPILDELTGPAPVLSKATGHD